MTWTVMMIVSSLLAFQSFMWTLIQATDVLAFLDANSCMGDYAVSCMGLAENKCCEFDRTWPTVLFKFSNRCEKGRIYHGNGCGDIASAIVPGSNPDCFTDFEQRISGASFQCLSQASSTQSLSSTEPAPCNSTMKPNAVVYRRPGITNGTWVLGTSEVHDMLLQLQLAPVDHKVDWMKSMGAEFKADSSS